MKTSRLIVLVLAAPLAACTVGGAGDDTTPPGDDTPPPQDFSGSVTQDMTLTGSVGLTNDVTIETGVTVTMSAGTALQATVGKAIHVKGTLLIQGAAGTEVTMAPGAGQGPWGGIIAETGGTVNAAYVTGSDVSSFLYSHMGSTSTLDHITFTATSKAIVAEGTVSITKSRFEDIKLNAGVNVLATGNLNAQDTYFFGSGGDTIVQTGGVLVLDHIAVGSSSTGADHCAMHLNEGSDVTVSYSIIHDTSVGLMIGGTTGASFTYNNFDNLTNLEDISSGTLNSGGVFDHNYITGTPITIPGITITNPEAAALIDVGPRP